MRAACLSRDFPDDPPVFLRHKNAGLALLNHVQRFVNQPAEDCVDRLDGCAFTGAGSQADVVNPKCQAGVV